MKADVLLFNDHPIHADVTIYFYIEYLIFMDFISCPLGVIVVFDLYKEVICNSDFAFFFY